MRLCPITLLALLCILPPACAAQGLSEDQVKASYVYNFIKFAEWPEGPPGRGNTLTVCVMGSESLGDLLGRLEGTKIGTRVLRVAKDRQYGDDLRVCQVVVVGESLQRRAAAIITDLADTPALTISGIEGFAEKGGCVGLLYRENRVLFEVNLEALRKKQLQLPAQVLNLAANVFGK